MFSYIKLFVSISSVILLDLLLPAQAQFTLNEIGLLQVVGEKQYFVENTVRFNWYKANQACNALNMTLASIESATEQQNLKNLLFQNSAIASLYWLSGNDLSTSRQFVWFGTGQPFSYTSWGTAGSASQRCIRTDANFNWVRDSCSNLRYFICEKPLLPKCGRNSECIQSPTIVF